MSNTIDKASCVKLMLDYNSKSIPAEYGSLEDARKSIYDALVSANGGSTKLSPRSFRNSDLYTIIEEYVPKAVETGLRESDFFNTLVETKVVGEGDSATFVTDKECNLIVADVAKGTQAIRRQRVGEKTTVTLTPTPKAVKAFEELTRVLAGRADIAELTDMLVKAVVNRRLEDIYGVLENLTSANVGSTFFPVAGSYDEDNLMDLCADVQAANNADGVIIVGTVKALRKLSTGVISDLAKDDYYHFGHARVWNGYDLLPVPQRFKVGTTTKAFDDTKLYILPHGMDKPIKLVEGGNEYLSVRENGENQDLTIDILLITNYVVGFLLGKEFGIYDMA